MDANGRGRLGLSEGSMGRRTAPHHNTRYLGTSAVLLAISTEENLCTGASQPSTGCRGPERVPLSLDPNPQRSQFRTPASSI